MKNIFICLCFLLYISLEAQAQINENMNYITTRVTDKNNTESGLTDIVYYDGLGREKESIRLGISPNGDDLYTHIVYDGLGNKVLESIPTPSSKNGAFVPFDYTANSDSGYIRNEYMRALNLPIKQTGPDAAWFLNSAGISYEYSGNCKYPVADYVISSTGRLERKGVFPANSLKCNTVWDEDKNKVETFTDNIGRVILTRRYDSSKAYDTYNVYDSRNRLCYIFPPMASDALITNKEYAMEKGGVLDLYAYYYQYDSYNRCVEKKLPGVEPIYYVYDKADRLVLSQSGNQRKKKQWLFHKYDFGGREIIMGILTTDKTVSFLTSYLNNKIVIETYTHNETSGSFGYTNNFSFSDDMEIITAHYYDTYDFISLSSFRNSTHSNTFLNYVHDNSYGIHYPNSKGLQTGVFVRQLDAPSRGEITAYYYDKAGQPVQIRSYYTPEGHSNVISSLYNYRGDLLRMQKKHTSGFYRYPYPPSDPRMLNDQKEEYEYEYDHAYRPVRLYHCHNDGERILLLENKYDELGRLQEKYRHNHTDTVAYTYNSRNWLTSIKSRNFTEHIYYNDSNTPAQYRRYNGNIGHINYVQGRPQSYKFQYDGLNRLVGVTTTGSSIIHYESYEYDKMGNITFLEHSQNDGNILNRLTMTYSGNQLQTATNEADFDPSYSELNYPDNSHADKEFFYDTNGNLTKNLNKEIVAIRYNILNLPDTIQFGNGNQIINSYLADGRKIKTIYKTYTTNIVVPQDIIWKSDDPCEISTDQWDGSYMYRSRTVKNGYVNHEMYMIQIPEGFISADHLGSDEERYYLYNYYVHDHLGNVRLSKSVESNVPAHGGGQGQHLVLGEVRLKVALHRLKQAGKAAQHRRGGGLLHHRPDDLHLVLGPLVVPLGKAHPLPGKGQRLDACQLVVALLVGADVLHGELPVGVDADAPQGVNHLHKAGEIHPQVVGDIHPVQCLQGVHRGFHPVDARVGQLVHGAPCLGEGHVEIPGRGQQEQALFPGVHRRQDVHVAAGQGGHRPKGIAAAEVDHEPFRGLLGDRGQRRLPSDRSRFSETGTKKHSSPFVYLCADVHCRHRAVALQFA